MATASSSAPSACASAVSLITPDSSARASSLRVQPASLISLSWVTSSVGHTLSSRLSASGSVSASVISR